MRRRSAASRLERLEELKGLLRARDHSTADALAAELRVSRRTLHRDLEILRESGFPIEADRGRGGGMRLHPNWALGRLQFSAAEAIDLLLSIAVAEQLNSPILLRHLGRIRRKVVAAFGETQQSRIRALRGRIFVGPPASERVAATRRVPTMGSLGALADAFVNAQCVRIDYVDSSGKATSREIEPHFLFLTIPVWYVLTWDRLRGAIRHFRADRIRAVKPLGILFRVSAPDPFIHDIGLRLAEL